MKQLEAKKYTRLKATRSLDEEAIYRFIFPFSFKRKATIYGKPFILHKRQNPLWLPMHKERMEGNMVELWHKNQIISSVYMAALC